MALTDDGAFNVTLADFKISMLSPISANVDHHCNYTSRLLAYDGDIDVRDGGILDVGLTILFEVLGTQLPPPLRDATAGQLVDWWANSVSNDTADTQAFLKNVTASCFSAACSTTSGIGDADIAGVGVILANTILTVLVLGYFVFALVHSQGPAQQGKQWHDCPKSRICNALRGTMEDVFDATLIYAIALHIATLTFQSRSATRYDVVYAESSCTFVSLAVLTLWHVRGDIARTRFHATGFFFIMCLLSVAVFILRIMAHLYPSTFWDQVCATAFSENWWTGRELMDFLCTLYFGLSMLTTVLPLQKMLRRFRARPTPPQMISKIRFTQSFVGGCGIMVYMVLLRETRNGFSDENSWGIGQYLAVATWIPSILKMIYIAIAGTQNTLTSYLPTPWVAVRSPDEEGINSPECEHEEGVCVVQIEEDKGDKENKGGQVDVKINITEVEKAKS